MTILFADAPGEDNDAGECRGDSTWGPLERAAQSHSCREYDRKASEQERPRGGIQGGAVGKARRNRRQGSSHPLQNLKYVIDLLESRTPETKPPPEQHLRKRRAAMKEKDPEERRRRMSAAEECWSTRIRLLLATLSIQ